MTRVPDEATRAIIDQASEWVIRMQDETASPREVDAFCAWLRRSPIHVREYLRAESVWSGLESVDPERRFDLESLLATGDENVVELSVAASTEARPEPARWRGRRPPAIAASLLVVALLGAITWLTSFPVEQHYETRLGEQRRLMLEDGSVLDMNTLTEITVRFSREQRTIELHRGEAYFTVTKDPQRPFVVKSELAVVRALGTQFNVYKRPDEVLVTVIEGRVAVQNSGSRRQLPPAGQSGAPTTSTPIELEAGDQATVAPSALSRRTSTNTRKITAWREHRIYFENDTLRDVVAEFNRYNARQMVIEDPELAERRIGAVFNTDEPDALIRFLTQDGTIEAVPQGPDRLLIRPIH